MHFDFLFLSNVTFSPKSCNLSHLRKFRWGDTRLDFRFIAFCRCARSETLCICTAEKLTHAEGNGMRVERGTEGEEIYDPPCSRGRTFLVLLFRARDGLLLALRYNHLDGYETILVARSDNLSRMSLQFCYASFAFLFFFLLGCNLSSTCVYNLKW